MEEKLDLIKKEAPGIKTMSLVADFSRMFGIAEYETEVAAKKKQNMKNSKKCEEMQRKHMKK